MYTVYIYSISKNNAKKDLFILQIKWKSEVDGKTIKKDI